MICHPNPVGWPETWSHRTLYNTPNAFIYATSPEAAGEADRMAERVAWDFKLYTGRTPGKLLLIVVDKNDPPYIQNEKKFREDLKRLSENPKLGGFISTSGTISFDDLTSIPYPVPKEELHTILGLPQPVSK